jgi:hypothetical protein
MKPTEKTICPVFSISQFDVGQLEVSSMAYSSYNQVCFSHEIMVRQADGGKGWGKVIFEGTLAELIKVVEKGTETDVMRIQWAGDFCRSESWTEPQ